MSEFGQAMKLCAGGLGTHLTRWPSGKYGFAGSMPGFCAYETFDEAILKEIAQSSFPAMVCKQYQIKHRGFDTEEQARAFAAEHNVQLAN
jgi:hypothetical protein